MAFETDLPLWALIAGFLGAAFVWGFVTAAARDFYRWLSRRKGD